MTNPNSTDLTGSANKHVTLSIDDEIDLESQANVNDALANSSSNEPLNNSDTAQPPPTYWQVPGTVPIAAGTGIGPPPTYQEVVDPNAPPPSYQSLFGQVQQAGKQCNKMAQLARHLLLLALGTVGMSVLLAGTVFIPFTMILIGISHMNDCPAEPIPLFLFVGGLVWLSRNIHNVFSKCSFNSSLLAAASSNRTERSASSSARSNARNDLNINRSACAFDCESNVNELGADQTESNNLNNTDCDLHLPSASRTYTCSINTNHEQLLSSSARAASAASDRPTPANRRQTMLHVFWLFWFVAGCAMVYRLFPPEYVDKSKPNYCDQSVYLFAFWLVTSVFIVFGLFVSCLCCVSIAALFSSPAARQRLSAGA